MENPHFGSKIKIPKSMLKSILQIHSCSVEKTAPKNTKYSRKETILKTGKNGKYGKDNRLWRRVTFAAFIVVVLTCVTCMLAKSDKI